MKAVLLALFAQDPTPAPPVQVDLRISPIVDLWFQARTHAATHQDLVARHPLAPLVRAMQDYEAGFGSARGWDMIEGNLLGCRSAADVARQLADLPATMSIRAPDGARRVELRALVEPLAAALVDAEPAWLEPGAGALPDTRFGPHSALTEAASRRWQAGAARHVALYSTLLDWLGMEFGAPPMIPVYLVANAPLPGARTVRTHDERAVCFVGVNQVPEGEEMLSEVIVHETIHALEQFAVGETLLTELRADMLAAGLHAQHPAYRNAPHTLFFFAAAAAVRLHLSREHEDYGDVAGYYDKMPHIAALERGLWKAYVAGELERAELIARIVKRFAPKRP